MPLYVLEAYGCGSTISSIGLCVRPVIVYKMIFCAAITVYINSCVAYYRVDVSRVEAVGPDRACAEWVLRLGGSVKFLNYENWSTDYNRLPSGKVKLEAIDGSGCSITSNGLEHLGRLL